MGKELINAAGLLPGLLPDVESTRLVNDLSAGLGVDDRGREALARLPTAVERRLLEKRQDDLISALGAFATSLDGTVQVKFALAALFSGYSSMANAATSPEQTLETYIGWLQDLPSFAVVEAVMLVGRGKAVLMDPATGKPASVGLRFPPTPAELHALAAPLAEPKKGELARVDRLLRIHHELPKPVSAEERERVKVAIVEFAQKLKSSSHGLNEKEKQAREAARARLAEAALAANRDEIAAQWYALGYEPLPGKDGVLHSPALLKKTGGWPPLGAVKLPEDSEAP